MNIAAEMEEILRLGAEIKHRIGVQIAEAERAKAAKRILKFKRKTSIKAHTL